MTRNQPLRKPTETERLLAWAVGWIEDVNAIPGQQVEEREGVPDASLWLSAHHAARWDGDHNPVCTDKRKPLR